MRIYTRVVCAWQPDGTLKQESAESFEHEGPVALCKDAGSPPPAPDYAGAARATNESARTNQYTPFGNLTWTPGQDARPASPGTAGIFDPATGQIIQSETAGTAATAGTPWSSQITLTPEAQRTLDTQMRTSEGLGNLSEQQLGRVQQQYSQPMDLSSVQDIADKAYAAQTSRLDPQWARREDSERTQLRNQGLVPGGEAWNADMNVFNQGRNDAYSQAILGSIATMPQTYQLANSAYNQPLNALNALRSGAQIQNPMFNPVGQGANMLGAAQAQGQYGQGLYGSQVAEANAGNQQTGQLASSALMAALMFGSDRRLKSNIVKVGDDPRGFGIYEYDIEGQRQRGVMADEVEQVMPWAVGVMPNGYLGVRYGML